MAFEPLQTDEKIEGPIVKKKDFDGQMLVGCSAFLIASIVGYLLAVWPFLVIQDIEKLSKFGLAGGLAGIPWMLWLAITARKGGLPAACGGLGGAMAIAVFLYIRLQQPFLAWRSQQVEKPEYPEGFITLIPIAIPIIAIIIGLTMMKKEEFDPQST